MLLWDQYSGLAWILQPSSCNEVNVDTQWHGGKCHVAGEDDRWPLWGWKTRVERPLTSLMSSSISAGLQSISVRFPPLAALAMAITALLPSEGGWGHEGLFSGHRSDSQVTHWSGHEDTSPKKLTLLLLLRHDAVDFVRFRNVKLGALGDLLKVRAFVQSTAKPGLPGGWLSLVPLLILAFKHSPGLWERKNGFAWVFFYIIIPGIFLFSKLMSNLENGRVHLLVVVLLASMFPRDSEQSAGLILPLEPSVLRALDLLHQPLLQPPTSRVWHLDSGKTTKVPDQQIRSEWSLFDLNREFLFRVKITTRWRLLSPSVIENKCWHLRLPAAFFALVEL